MEPNSRSDRILTGKLDLLYRSAGAIATNFMVAVVVAWLLHGQYPDPLLIGWLTAVFVACAARIALQYRYRATLAYRRCAACWARYFAAGALVSGLLWGLICLGLPAWGERHDFILMAVAAAGMSAGALAGISIFFPAFILYTASFILPLAGVALAHEDAYIRAIGVMLLVYLFGISFVAKRNNHFVAQTLELKVDNEMLHESLAVTEIERDLARDEKWSTLAQLSHELRTPLNAILGFSEAMHGEYFGPLGSSRYKDYTGHMLSSGRHLLAITDELLQISQGESGQLQLDESDVDLASLLRNVVDVMTPDANKAELALVAEVPSGLPGLRADANKLHQMVANLVDNAIKFTPPGGRVVLRAWASAAGGVMVAVEDTGIGMRPADIPKAMKPFGRLATPLTNQTSGAGLGLPITKRLAELHGAELSLESAAGKGTVCTIAFPLARTQLPKKDAAAA